MSAHQAQVADLSAPTLITMSISVAPSTMARRVS
jgi:hypothetical protein